ncbi:hypothetical protein [Pseudoalteromonas sp. S2755]|uniref:hypothetical protein n=1 Tax=Pseudoalteromonas sp. S2755 TaxID=2066523 RepID=UPI00110A6C78|nr:hypothetical protein [Pseudoalteromonas sp. S2755]TMN41106.1 hypothetical protein CWC03_08160 [Pseudoalteromonas sp. S2755]
MQFTFALPSPNCMITISATSMDSPAASAVIIMRNGNLSTDGKAPNDPNGNADSIIHLKYGLEST